MTSRIHVYARRVTALLGAGMIFQATGCSLAGNELAAQLTLAIAQNLLSNLVFGSFNLIP